MYLFKDVIFCTLATIFVLLAAAPNLARRFTISFYLHRLTPHRPVPVFSGGRIAPHHFLFRRILLAASSFHLLRTISCYADKYISMLNIYSAH